MPTRNYSVTRPLDDYGPETTHSVVAGRTLVLRRGDQEVIALDPDTEETFLRSLSGRFTVEETSAAPGGIKDPGLATFVAGAAGHDQPDTTPRTTTTRSTKP